MPRTRRWPIRPPSLQAIPIRVRIACFGVVVVALTIAVFSTLLYALIAAGAPNEQDQQLRRRAEEALATIERTPAAGVRTSPPPPVSESGVSSDLLVRVLGPDGAPIDGVAEPPDLGTIPPGLLVAATANGSALDTLPTTDGEPYRVYVVTWSRPDLGLNGHVIVAQATRRMRNDLRGLRVFLWLSAGITLLAVSAAMWAMAGRALKPLKEMARAADEIGHARDLSRRLAPGRANDEVARLSASFNGMLARLEDAYQQAADALESQKRFVSDASHELRTPLTSIRSNAGFLLGRPDARPEDVRAALQDVAEESGRMSRLIDSLLTLARADAGLQLERSEVDLEALLREVARQATVLHPDRAFRLRVLPDHGPADALADDDQVRAFTVCGNEDALRQLVWVLVENAVRHAPAEGTVWLTLTRRGPPAERPDEVLIWLQVADDGVGIPEADLERIFERFYRADASRTGEGTGLGLSIARWIVTEHGGRLWARNNELGGATFTVELPDAARRFEAPGSVTPPTDLESPQLSSSS